MHPILRGKIPRAAIAGLALLACSDVRAEDPVIPGLEMDALSTRTVEAWRKKVTRTPTRFAEAPVAIKHPTRRGLPTFVEGTYRFDLATGKIVWNDAARGRTMEQAWWRQQLEWILREPGLLFYFAHSSLTGEEIPAGVTIRVTGRSPMRVLRFDRSGNLTGLTVKMAVPGGGTQDAEISLTHERLGTHLLLTKYVADTPAPGGLRSLEAGGIRWRTVHGRPLPTAFRLDLRQGSQKMGLVVELGPWKLDAEAHARPDAVSGRVLGFWENREYNLGRRGIVAARCDLEFDDGGTVARGRYHWDGKAGKETWRDPALGKRLGSQWRKTLDDVFRRYPLREEIGVRDLIGSKQDGMTIVRIEDVFPGGRPTGYRRLTFGSGSTLRSVELVRPDGTEGVLTPIWRRFEYPKGHLLAGMLQYMAPTRWTGAWARSDGSTYKTTKSITYAAAKLVHVPSSLQIQFSGEDVRTRTLVFRFRNWKLTKRPPLR